MSALILIAIAWVIYPFIGIPLLIGSNSENKKLKEKIKALQGELDRLTQNGTDVSAINAKAESAAPESVDISKAADFAERINNGSIESGTEDAAGIMGDVPELKAADPVSEDGLQTENSSAIPAVNYTVTDNGPTVLSTPKVSPSQSEGTPNLPERNTAEDRKAKNVSGLLITGVSMVLLAGLIFVTTNWSLISEGFKIFLIILVTLMFFGVSGFAEKTLGLDSTSKGFFTLGTLFVPITCVSMFFFEIFGEWLSFSGDGKMLALMSVFLSCSLSCGLITWKYRNNISAFFTMLFISAAVCAFAFFAASEPFVFAVFFIIAAIYSTVLLIIKPEMLNRFEIPFVYTDVYSMFSKLNAFIFALISIICSAADGSTAEAAAAVAFLFAITLYMQTLTEKTSYKKFFNIASVVEYFIFSQLVSDILSDKYGWAGYSTTFLVTVLLCIPAMVIYTFIPKFRSDLSQAVLLCLQFTVSMCNFEDGSAAGCVILLLMIIAAAVFKNTNYKTIGASVMSVPLFAQILFLMNADDYMALILSFIVSVLFLVSLILGRKNVQFKPASVVFAAYSALIPLVTAVGEPEDMKKLLALLLSMTAFAFAAVISSLGMEKVRTAVYTVAVSVHFQIFAYLMADSHIFADSDPALYDGAYFPMYLTAFAVMAFVMVAGILTGRFDRIMTRALVSSSVLITFITFVMYTPYSTGHWVMVFELVFAAYFLVSGFAYSDNTSKIMWSAAACIFGYAVAAQNIVPVTGWFQVEYYVLCSFIPYIFLYRIWRNENERETLGTVMYVHACVGIGVLAVNAIAQGELSHALFIGLACIAFILIGFITGQKKWSKLGTITLIILTFYMTKDFWASLAWWVYLLTAGVFLIFYAGINEYCRKTGRENVIRTGLKNLIAKAFEKD